MEVERGRKYKEKLENAANEYLELHNIFKQVIRSEESIIHNRSNFRKKWLEAANIKNQHPALSTAFSEYGKALGGIEQAHRESTIHMKVHVLEALRKYPMVIKEQKRSLSKSSRDLLAAQKKGKELSKRVDRNEPLEKINDASYSADEQEQLAR